MPSAADLCDFCSRLHIYSLVFITSCKALSKTRTHMRMHKETTSRNQVHPRFSHVRSHQQSTMFSTFLTIYPICSCSIITWVSTLSKHSATTRSGFQALMSVHSLLPCAQRACLLSSFKLIDKCEIYTHINDLDFFMKVFP